MDGRPAGQDPAECPRDEGMAAGLTGRVAAPQATGPALPSRTTAGEREPSRAASEARPDSGQRGAVGCRNHRVAAPASAFT
jgi:hypothetical protein